MCDTGYGTGCSEYPRPTSCLTLGGGGQDPSTPLVTGRAGRTLRALGCRQVGRGLTEGGRWWGRGAVSVTWKSSLV